MATIKISVTGEICTVAQKVTFTAGSYGVYVAEVTTDASWDDLALVLCIISAPPGYPRMPNSGRCIKRSIPIKDGTAELDETIQPCMVSDNAILIGLLGCDADGKITRYSTVSAAGKVCGSGCIDDTILGDESRWAELISYINATIKSLIGTPTDEQVRNAIDSYAGDYGITTGATAAEAAQIEQNTEDITNLKSDLSQLSEEIVELDTALTQSGKAADAKVVGDALNAKVSGIGITTIMAITQEDYDDLVTLEQVSETTLYIISDHTGSIDGGGTGDGGSEVNMIPYLVSDGTAYVKLGIAPVDGASYEVCIRASGGLGTGCVFGNRWTCVIGAGGGATNQWMVGYYNGSAYATFGSSVLDVSKKRVFTLTNNSLVLDNDVITEITEGTNTKVSIMYLFARNFADTNNGEYLAAVCAFTFFYLKIRDANGNLIYYYRPAQDDSGVACVYEAVNGTYLYNAADSGSFTYGEELEES